MKNLHISIAFCVMLLLVIPVYAVDVFKVSEYAGGHQIWFEAEAFDARDPDSENTPGIGFKIVEAETNIDLPEGAFGDALVNVSGNDNIWIMYNFDISECGGKRGTWYIRSREINPGNRSEWLWVLDDDGDEIPNTKPIFDKADDRAFDADTGPPWAWVKRSEGEAKELRDGENTMMFWYREGNTTALRDVFVWCDTPGYTPTDDDYVNAEEIRLKPEPVEPGEKLTMTWGGVKVSY